MGWDAYDVLTSDGSKVDVKSSAYLHSWKQERLSPLSFRIPRIYGWDARTNTRAEVKSRQADVYVFCVLAHRDNNPTVDSLNIDQWVFHCAVFMEALPCPPAGGARRAADIRSVAATGDAILNPLPSSDSSGNRTIAIWKTGK